MATLLNQLAEKVQKGEIGEVSRLIRQALNEGISAEDILNNGLLKGLHELSNLFRNNDVFIAELLQASKAMNVGMSLIKDSLAPKNAKAKGKIIIATVEGDVHDIGKNLIKYVIEGMGNEVIDLGSDVPAQKIVAAVREHKPQVLALSALLTTTMTRQQEVIEALEAAGLRKNLKIIVGGAPVTKEFCRAIGADGFAINASDAVELLRDLI